MFFQVVWYKPAGLPVWGRTQSVQYSRAASGKGSRSHSPLDSPLRCLLLSIFLLFFFTSLISRKLYLVNLQFISLVIFATKRLLRCARSYTHISCFVNYPFIALTHFFFYFCHLLICREALHSENINLLPVRCVANIFFSLCLLLFFLHLDV